MCPACGAATPEGARFCSSCGHHLQRGADERRVVTVLFADLVGFTGLSEARDPEQVKNLVDQCFERLVADLDAHGGRVDKIIGDAIVALFGAPVAHEDDPERAVRAGLQMQQTLVELAREIGIELQLRIGVNTGEVLVGAMRSGGDYTAMGDVVNVASRLQNVASPGQVVVGPETYVCTRDVVRYESLGTVRAKGRDGPVEAWSAVEALAPPGRRPRRAPTPLVGREHEMALLRHAMATAAIRRRPQFVLLLGEAGVGKSRLAEEAAALASREHGATVVEGRCVPYGEANVWWPIAEALRQGLGIELSDAGPAAADKVRTAVREVIGAGDQDAGRLTDGILYLLGYEGVLRDVDPVRAREEARRAIYGFIEAAARERPLVVVLSELHWADPLLLELLDELFVRSRGLPVVVLATARPELEGTWLPHPGIHNSVVLHVEPLDTDATSDLLASLLGERPPAEVRTLLLERSGGNPLFLEEMVALLSEAGVLAGADGRLRIGDDRAVSELPATLRGLVAARIDGLSREERAVLEDAAIVGRTGALETLQALAGDPPETPRTVEELARKDLLLLDEDDGEWAFRSELVREVTYETLTKAERARRHSAVATWLEAHQHDRGEDAQALEQLAHHYGTAAELAMELGRIPGVPDDILHRALKTIEQAAMRAEQADMHLLSIRLLDQAERLLPGGDVHNHRRVHLARAQAHAKLRRLDEARRDLDAVTSDPEAMASLPCQAAVTTIIGDIQQKEGALEASIATLEEAVALWRQLGDRRAEADALRNLGFTKMMSHDLDGAESAIAQALEVSRQAGDRRVEAWALQNLAWISFQRGDVATAEDRITESVEAFAAVGDWGGRGWALGLLAFVRYFEGRLDEAAHLAEVVLRDARDTGDRWALAMVLALVASVRLWQGRPVEALAPAREARDIFTALGDTGGEQMVRATLLRALIATGAVAEARQLLDAPLDGTAGGFGRPRVHPGVLAAMAAADLGEPDEAVQALRGADPGPLEEGVLPLGEQEVVGGIIQLQLGRPPEAVARLRAAEQTVGTDGERAAAHAYLALALAADGHPAEAVRTAAKVVELSPAGTYLDQAVAAMAEGFALFQLGQRPEAERAFARALATVDRTGDCRSQAVVRLAYGQALDGIGDPAAAEVLDDARGRLTAMGVAAPGWDTAFRAAAEGAAVAQG